MPTPISLEAKFFAKEKHMGQFRKDGKTEYFKHLEDVIFELESMGVTDEDMLCVGWLHDTVEDTNTDHDDLIKKFGNSIAHHVVSITKDARLTKEEQERQYGMQLERAPWQGKIVKLADIIANFKDLPNGYPEKEIQDVKVKNKLQYIFAIKSELIFRNEVPDIEHGKEELNKLLKKHGQEQFCV